LQGEKLVDMLSVCVEGHVDSLSFQVEVDGTRIRSMMSLLRTDLVRNHKAPGNEV